MKTTQLIVATFVLLLVGLPGVVFSQDGELIPPSAGETPASVLAQVQAKVSGIQTLKADLEFDRKGDKPKKNKKKKKINEDKPVQVKWDEPEGREVERGPLEIAKGQGARLFLERKKSQELFVANGSTIWKHDIDDKEARHIPANWPIIDTFVANALKINVFVAMDSDTLKLRGAQKVNGTECWLLEGKSPSKLAVVGVESTKMKIWVGKEDGIPRLISVPSENDTMIRLKNIKLNVPIDAGRFSYTPPSGVEIKNILGF